MSAFITDVPVLRRPRANPEDQLQRAVMQLLALRKVDPHRYHHVPNGSYKSKAAAGRMKALGLKAGIPDLAFILPDGRAAFVELKAPKGRLSPAQKDYAAWCKEKRVPHAVCTSVDEVDAALRVWGMFDRGEFFKANERVMFAGVAGGLSAPKDGVEP